MVDNKAATGALEGEELTLTATPQGDYQFVRWTITTSNDRTRVLTTNPATFTMPADAITVDVRLAVPPDGGVVIGGSIWATCNVGDPGTFVDAPENRGSFYKWGQKRGWSTADPLISSDGLTEWDDTFTTGEEWTAANDPSPEGWRVPTVDEVDVLLNSEHVNKEPIDIPEGVKFTDELTGNSIFIPAAGAREVSSGLLYRVGRWGYYWLADSNGAEMGYIMYFYYEAPMGLLVAYNGAYHHGYGLTIRPVAE
jgi:hypothetical protein